jgi:periplasmic nitrate reductase NapD
MSMLDICGVLVSARQDNLPQVRWQLAQIPGVEVHAVTANGRLVVTVEGGAGRSTVDTVSGLLDVAGVLATSIVYQHSEFAETQQESAS